MCLLQLLSGHIARVDKLIYHALSEKDQILIQKAVKECEKIVNVMKEKEQKDGSMETHTHTHTDTGRVS